MWTKADKRNCEDVFCLFLPPKRSIVSSKHFHWYISFICWTVCSYIKCKCSIGECALLAVRYIANGMYVHVHVCKPYSQSIWPLQFENKIETARILRWLLKLNKVGRESARGDVIAFEQRWLVVLYMAMAMSRLYIAMYVSICLSIQSIISKFSNAG